MNKNKVVYNQVFDINNALFKPFFKIHLMQIIALHFILITHYTHTEA